MTVQLYSHDRSYFFSLWSWSVAYSVSNKGCDQLIFLISKKQDRRLAGEIVKAVEDAAT